MGKLKLSELRYVLVLTGLGTSSDITAPYETGREHLLIINNSAAGCGKILKIHFHSNPRWRTAS